MLILDRFYIQDTSHMVTLQEFLTLRSRDSCSGNIKISLMCSGLRSAYQTLYDLHLDVFRLDIRPCMTFTLMCSGLISDPVWPSPWCVPAWYQTLYDLHLDVFRLDIRPCMTFTLMCSGLISDPVWPSPWCVPAWYQTLYDLHLDVFRLYIRPCMPIYDVHNVTIKKIVLRRDRCISGSSTAVVWDTLITPRHNLRFS